MSHEWMWRKRFDSDRTARRPFDGAVGSPPVVRCALGQSQCECRTVRAPWRIAIRSVPVGDFGQATLSLRVDTPPPRTRAAVVFRGDISGPGRQGVYRSEPIQSVAYSAIQTPSRKCQYMAQ
jgi:hypothetical protein